MEDNINGRQSQWKTASMEDNLNGRQPQWKWTSMKDNLNGRQPQKRTSMEEDASVLIKFKLKATQQFMVLPQATLFFV